MKTLTIFYIFNYKTDIDVKFIDEYLRIFLNYNLSCKYNIVKVLNVTTKFDEKKDVIENGFVIFNELQTRIMSLDDTDPNKNSDFIFLYIGNGNICNKAGMLHENVDVLLLNDNILKKNSYYTINNNTSNILSSDNLCTKLNKIKMFRKTLDNIFTLSDKNILQYT